jgi:WD40 repeat protein
LLAELPTHTRQGFSVDLASNGDRIVSYGLDQIMRIWSTKEKRMLAKHPLSLGARFLRLHPDGKHVASPMPRTISEVADEELAESEQSAGDLALWDLDRGRVVKCFDGLTNWAMYLEFSQDGKYLLAATVSDGAVVWRLSDNQRWQFQALNQSIATRAILMQDERSVLTGHRDGHVHVWDLETGQIIRKMVCHGDEITCLLECRKGNRVLTGCKGNSRLRVWDWTTGQCVGQLDTGVAGISSVRMTHDESSIVIGGTDGGIRVLRIAAGRVSQ